MTTEVEGFEGLEKHLKAVSDSLGDANSVKTMLTAAAFAAGGLRESVRSLLGGSGTLARSFSPSLIEASEDNITTAALSSLVYAGVMDRPETTIRAVKRKFLTIPLKPFPPGTRANEFPDLKFITSKKGNKLLARITGKGKKAKIEPFFLLREEITVHGVGYIDDAWGRVQEDVEAIIAEGLGQGIDDA